MLSYRYINPHLRNPFQYKSHVERRKIYKFLYAISKTNQAKQKQLDTLIVNESQQPNFKVNEPLKLSSKNPIISTCEVFIVIPTRAKKYPKPHQSKQKIKNPLKPRNVPNDNERLLELLSLGDDPIELGLAADRHELHRDRRIIELPQRPFWAQSPYRSNRPPDFIKFTGKNQGI